MITRREFKKRTGGLFVAALSGPLAGAAPADAEAPLLSAITGLIQWVGSLSEAIDEQVEQARRRRLRRSLFGLITHLGRLEDSKREINEMLAESAPDEARIEAALEILREDLQRIRAEVSRMRAEIGGQLAKEGAQLEREITGTLAARQQTVEAMLRRLRLPAPGEPVDQAALRESSEALVQLIHKAQDAANELAAKLR